VPAATARDALAKVGSFTLIEEHEFLSDLRKVRRV
jgi:hypothetical protein